MPQIVDITTVPFSLALKAPLRWGLGHEMHRLEHVLVRVRLDDGSWGLGEINPRPTIYGETPETATAIIQRYIAPLLVGQTLSQTSDIPKLLDRYRLLKNNHSARAGVDIALWGALAMHQRVSFSELVGAKRPAVRVSYILGTGSTTAVLAELQTVIRAGVRVIKVKVGKDIERELRLVRQIKTTYPSVDFYIDANETFMPDHAQDRLTWFAEAGARYCEEPLPVHQLNERASLRHHSPIPLIGDDSCFTLADVERELSFNTFDVLNIKPPRNGVTETLTMIETAQQHGKPVMMGGQASSIFGCIVTLILGALPHATEPSEGTFWLRIDDTAQLPLNDGLISLSELDAAYDMWRQRLAVEYF